ncbi:family 78 glycoside hydrolase catalytic domain [Bythopirellula polymerisocia]|uniref:family 78 glycoside hydrolase catalytic domain n=1 Tax=Bythopirellula polymerisocia TaxID=2528003 RepID=UPI0011B5C8BA|nr:family 78 glycoside hydrolase catalytic domain [Bythopirellula polymerisocia]
MIKPAWIFALALVVQLAFMPLVNADPFKSSQVSKVAMRASLPKLDPSKPPARETVAITRQSPQTIKLVDSDVVLIDFGRVAFGNLELTSPADFEGTLKVRFGEKLLDGLIDREPPGTVRCSEVEVEITPGATTVIAPPADERNTQQTAEIGRYGKPTPPAVLTPPEWGVLTPFRWVEIEGLPDALSANQIVRRAAFPKHWDENSAAFVCSNETLNRVWELCRYSIKATMFAGVYVDGDRERIPYEADAYLNQLSHYYVDGDPVMARQTFDWLTAYPTWPSEWGPHMVFMAHADWMRNGDDQWISQRYENLKTKTLIERCGDSGLVHSDELQREWNDIVDWPPPERDGYVRTEVNTVINAFHFAAIEKMAELADVAGSEVDAKRYKDHAERVRQIFYDQLFDVEAGLFRDGLGVDHHSQHANFFPLAFGLVETKDRQHVVDWLTNRGMQCSTYAAQYLLDCLFKNGAGETAVKLIIAPGKRSWRHMLDSDATITWEAWNESVKPNLDWNHAWGAAPANLLPRYVLGAEPLEPGWSRAIIRPYPSGLDFARGIIPTPYGPVSVDWNRKNFFEMELKLPDNMSASVHVPTVPGTDSVFVNGQLVEAKMEDGYWILKEDLTGESIVELRSVELQQTTEQSASQL